MKVYSITEIPVTVKLEDAAARLHVTDDLMDEFSDVFEECLHLARPKCLYAQYPVTIDGCGVHIGDETFESRIMRVNLAGKRYAFPGVSTCGRELYERAMACDDLLEQFWVDGIAEMTLIDAGRALRDGIQSTYGTGRLRGMSPGSLADFPIFYQRALFRLLGDTEAEIGVELAPQCLMLPYKSGSSIYFESEEEFENCSLCLREGCPNRRAAFNERMFAEKYGLTEADAEQTPGR